MADLTLELTAGGDIVRLRYVAEGTRIYVVASDPQALWPASVLRTGRASFRLGSDRGEGSATLVTDPATRDRLLARFRSEAGQRGSEMWFAHPGRLIAICAGDTSGSAERYDGWLREEFDWAAPDYAERIESNPVERGFRRRSIALLRRTFPRPSRLLEIGSGAGVETIPMLEAGHQVLAVDVSEGMLARLGENAHRAGQAEGLTTLRLRARDLGSLSAEYGPASFDGGFSTFGALSLEPDLGPVARGLGALIRHGGRFVAGAYGRHAVLEPLATALSGHPGRLRGRWRRPAPVGTHRFPVDVYFRSPREIRTAFATLFELRHTEGLGILVPPPNLAERFDRWGARWDRLERWDAVLGRWGPFAGWGDQFLAVLQRSEGQ
ncbi:MAG: class I SAM-dependent methyltransferase [Thermoplasmata archaeon]|nr:class I SAM-dependent methyltransferase [Thermoplasmata archaeon]MCI4332518.1 class I SAM-dependent methyltransferase [Thermoplasmata archaeon]